jgi:hypothetical protein
MSWNNVDTQCKLMYGDQFAELPKPEDRKVIIRAIADEFPNFSRTRIAASVDQCFKINSVPFPRRTFLVFVRDFFK